MLRSLRQFLADVEDAVLLEAQVRLVRLGERLLAYAAECDPTPEFLGDEEDTHA